MSQHNLLLVDGNHLLHMNCRSSSMNEENKLADGTITTGACGFINCIRYALEKKQFSKCVVVWDGGRSKRRLKILPEYKSNRKIDESNQEEVDYLESFNKQRNILQEFLPNLNIREACLNGREADDVIWLVRKKWREVSGGYTLVLSEDKDFYQMIDVSTDLYRPIRQLHVTTENFLECVKVPMDRFLLFKSVFGDAGDAIGGIEGVGEKTAVQIANEAPVDWNEVPEWCKSHSNKRIRSVAEHFDIVRRNYSLVTFDSEVFDHHEEGFIYTKIFGGSNDRVDFDMVLPELKKLGFKNLTNRFHGWSIPFRRLT